MQFIQSEFVLFLYLQKLIAHDKECSWEWLMNKELS